MGTLTSMDCPCGFQEQVEYGCGMSTDDVAVFPHFCSNCGLVSAAIDERNRACPTCGSYEIIMYGERDASGPLSIAAESDQSCDLETWTHDPRVTRPEGRAIFDWNDCRISIGFHLCPSCGKFDMVTGRLFMASFD
jgi:hypothetical protein